MSFKSSPALMKCCWINFSVTIPPLGSNNLAVNNANYMSSILFAITSTASYKWPPTRKNAAAS